MALYMPAPHRAFLTHLSLLQSKAALSTLHENAEDGQMRSIRDLVLSPAGQAYPALTQSYNEAVHAMQNFRKLHMQLVDVFIVAPSRKPPSRDSVFWPEWETKMSLKLRESQQQNASEAELKGTGGTALVTFLRSIQQRTLDAVVKS